LRPLFCPDDTPYPVVVSSDLPAAQERRPPAGLARANGRLGRFSVAWFVFVIRSSPQSWRGRRRSGRDARLLQEVGRRGPASPGASAVRFRVGGRAVSAWNGAMKSLTEYLWFHVPERRGYLNITDTVAELVRRSGVQEGLCLVNAMHITASVYINDAEDGLLHDYDVWLEKLAPHEPVSQYWHNRTGEDNADAHLKRQIMGREVVVAITRGRLDLGPWEQIFYGEFDGRRRKRVLVKIIGE
jgi:secondary thiamine-phosphate synthase enzyme